MIDPSAYRASITNMDVKLLHMESIMRRHPGNPHAERMRDPYTKLTHVRNWMYFILFAINNHNMVIDNDKITPTKAGVTDLVYTINTTLRKRNISKDERTRLNIIKSEFMKLKEELQ